MDESSFVKRAMQIAHRLARRRYRFHPDRDEKAHDAATLAWEFCQKAPPEATPGTIANFAVKHGAIGRQFKQSTRSIDGPKDRRQPVKPSRLSTGFELHRLPAPGADPAEVACFWLTFPDWLESLSPRNRLIALAMIEGYQTGVIAERFDLSAPRISQLRQELREDWEVFTA